MQGAYLWLPFPAYGLPAGMNYLGTLGGQGSTADGINETGQIVGGAQDANGNWRAYLRLPSPAYGLPAGMNNLGTLGLSSFANAINNAGQIAGESNPGNGYHAFLWLPSPAYGLPAGMNDLGVPPGESQSNASAINSLGQVVGSTSTAIASHAFVWLPSAAYRLPAGMNGLGTLGGAGSEALGINNTGQVVGDALTSAVFPTFHAFLWQSGHMYDLNDMVSASSGWVLQVASAINDTGQIAGWGYRIDETGTSAFLLTPIDYASTTVGGNAGQVSVTIVRPSLQDGASVKLSIPGQPDIQGTNTHVVFDPNFQSTVLYTTFDLRGADLTGATPGPRTVVVTQPSGTTLTLSNTFTVEEGGGPNLQVQLTKRDKVRIGYPSPFQLSVVNNGSVDAVAVPVWLAGIPEDAQVSWDFQPAPPAMGLSNPYLVDTGSQRMAPFIVPRVPAHSQVDLQFELTFAPDTPSSVRLAAWTNTLHQLLTKDSIQQPQVNDCFETLLRAILASAGHRQEPDAAIKQGVASAVGQLQAMITHVYENADVPGPLTSLTQLIEQAAYAVDPSLDSVALSQAVNQLFPQLHLLAPPCFGKEQEQDLSITVGNSEDPNSLSGPLSAAAPWLNGSAPLTLQLTFDNIGTAPAARVLAQLGLDGSALDLTSVSLEPITIGSAAPLQPLPNVSPIATLREFNGQLDLGGGRSVGVNSNVNLDTGLLSWTFTASDLNVGFLPPGQSASVVVSVYPKRGLPTGTPIDLSGSIKFDVNPTQNTPSLHYLLDNSKPVSQVLPLAPIQAASPFQVQWSATDEGSGVQDVTIYVSDNGAAFTPWLTNTTQTSAMYSGVRGHTYSFVSQARDRVGNVEDLRNVADTSTTMTSLLDVTGQVRVVRGGYRLNHATGRYVQQVTLTNVGGSVIEGPVSLVLDHLSGGVSLFNASGVTQVLSPLGSPYVDVLTGGSMGVGSSVSVGLEFGDPANKPISYTPRVLAGTGTR